MKKILEVKGLTKKIGKKTILDDITFDIEKGKIVGLVGKNGAGKSTLLKTIVGLIRPTKGNIYINGIDISKDFETAIKSVGSMIEVPSMYDYMSGIKNLNIFKMMFKGISEETVKEIIKLVSLEGSEYKKLKHYSLGMRQRLGLALALLNNPKLLILDEPTNGLDPVGIKDLRKFLKTLNDTAIIISSHMLSEIENICDEVLFIDKGKIVSKSEINKTKKYKLYVDDESKVKKLLKHFDISENLTIKTSDINKISDYLYQNNIKIFSVAEEKENLEQKFLSLLEKKDD